jgi:hypothetical protein
MARPRSWTWTAVISLLVGIAAATVFWQYSQYGEQLSRQSQPLSAEVKGGALHLQKPESQATGSRFQMVTDGKQVFVMDLKSGRVWRYYHQTKEAGFSREDEGFLPIPFYYAGKKHYAASEIEPPAVNPVNPAEPGSQEKQPQ